jgi:hypothetical protein
MIEDHDGLQTVASDDTTIVPQRPIEVQPVFWSLVVNDVASDGGD